MIAQEAARHSPLTIKWYEQRLGRFMRCVQTRGIESPEAISATDCRSFIVELSRQQLKDNTVHGYAQVVKTFCRFLQREGFSEHDAMEHVAMPKVAKRIMPAFKPQDVKKLLGACRSKRDTAMLLGLVDSDATASEFAALRVCDVDMRTGATRIIHGKGGKDRTCYLGARARRALIGYLRGRDEASPSSPLWLSKTTGEQLTYYGLAQALKRLGQRPRGASALRCSAQYVWRGETSRE
jgi:integrase/recombinase XerD